jgi:hypothetical protein
MIPDRQVNADQLDVHGLVEWLTRVVAVEGVLTRASVEDQGAAFSRIHSASVPEGFMPLLDLGSYEECVKIRPAGHQFIINDQLSGIVIAGVADLPVHVWEVCIKGIVNRSRIDSPEVSPSNCQFRHIL